MSANEEEFLIRFRHSGYAVPLRDLLQRRLVDARTKNETERASETNQSRVLAVRNLLEEIFGEE